MKELSIEQKAQRYDEMSKDVKDFFDGKLMMYSDVKQTLNYLFPELKESEDESNIKDLIDELKCSLRAANCQNDACGGGHEKRIALLEWGIAWLEKQGQKHTWSENDEKIITALKEGFRYHQLFNPTFGEVPNAEIIAWFKSLKERLS